MFLLSIVEVCLESLVMNKLSLVATQRHHKNYTSRTGDITVMCTLPAAAGAIIPAAIAQEEDDALLEDDDLVDLASDIASEVLDDSGDAEDESDQVATNTGTVNPNQDQTLGQDNVGEFADETADLDDTNVAVPIAVPINVDLEREKEEEEEEEEKQPRPKKRPKLT